VGTERWVHISARESNSSRESRRVNEMPKSADLLQGEESRRAALYARVSTEEQVEGYSIDAQRRAFRELCTQKAWTPIAEYIEEGRSAHTEDISKRPVFKEAIEAALSHHYDVLVVHKIDRFSRKLKVTLDYFDKLHKAGVTFVSIGEQIDFSTPTGQVFLAMVGAFSQF